MRSVEPLRRAAWSLAALLAAPPATLAGEIAGRVVISEKPAADVAVAIEGLAVESPRGGAVSEIDHRGLDFVPHVLVVRSGARVQFRNSDGMPCHIYSISPAGPFILRRPAGGAMAVTFREPGVIEVRCAEHGRITAYVIVLENPLFAITDREGRYEIPEVPAGRHTLQVFHEGRLIKTKTVRVGTGKATVDFKVPRIGPAGREGGTPNLEDLERAVEALPAGLHFEFTEPPRSQP